MRKVFKKGDVVWGQSNDQPIWPAQVAVCVKQVIFEMPDDLYEVVFVNDNSKQAIGQARAVLKNTMMYDFLKHKSRYDKSLHKRNFKEAVRLAEEKAKRIRDQGTSSSVDFSKEQSRSRKREQSPSPNLSKRKKATKHAPVEGSRVFIGRSNKRSSPSSSSILGKRKRTFVDSDKSKAFRRYDDRLDEEENREKRGRKKLKRDTAQSKSPKRQSPDSVPVAPAPPQSSKPDPELLAKLKSKLAEPQSDSRSDSFKELVRRVDDVTTRIITISDGDTTRLPEGTLSDLDQILKLIRQNKLRIEDLMVKDASSKLYFIVKFLAKREECRTVVRQLNEELKNMEESLMKAFKATEKYEGMMEEVRRERALAEAEAEAEADIEEIE